MTSTKKTAKKPAVKKPTIRHLKARAAESKADRKAAAAAPKPKPLQSPFLDDVMPHVDGVIDDMPPFTTTDAVIESLYSRKQRMLATVKEATTAIPDNVSDIQRRALEVVRATAHGDAMRAVGEFSSFLSAARASRWIDYQTFIDGVTTMKTLLARGPR